jgi:hypothetical protein
VDGQRVVLAPLREARDAQVARGADPDLDHFELARPLLRADLADGRAARDPGGVHEPEVLVRLLGPDEAVNL